MLKEPRLIEDLIFITAVGKHHPATSATIARWIKTGLSKAEDNTSIFKAHSVRSAATLPTVVSVTEIMEAADWTSANVFEKFYIDLLGPQPLYTQ